MFSTHICGRNFNRFVYFFILAIFLIQTVCPPNLLAQSVTLISNHQPPTTNPFLPVGLSLNPQNPFQFELLVDQGDSSRHSEAGLRDEESQSEILPVARQDDVQQEGMKLIKYFLAALTISEKDMWVNLSPAEPDRIVPPVFAQTAMGRDMLAQDFILKQLTSSLMNPEGEAGKKFWEKIYEKVYEKVSAVRDQDSGFPDSRLLTPDTLSSFNKIWIIPDKAVVYQNGHQAYVVESRLKVMLEEDYLLEQSSKLSSPNATHLSPSNATHLSSSNALIEDPVSFEGKSQKKNSTVQDAGFPTKTFGNDNVEIQSIIRETILPIIEDEVNNGESFANLRQMYRAMILAYWFKQNLKKSLLGQVYVNKNKISGIRSQESEKAEDNDAPRLPAGQAGTTHSEQTIEEIYNQYVAKFKQGAFDVIKEDYDPQTQTTVARKYFSGGTDWASLSSTYTTKGDVATFSEINGRAQMSIKFQMDPVQPQADDAMMAVQEFREELANMINVDGKPIRFDSIKGQLISFYSFATSDDLKRSFVRKVIGASENQENPGIKKEAEKILKQIARELSVSADFLKKYYADRMIHDFIDSNRSKRIAQSKKERALAAGKTGFDGMAAIFGSGIGLAVIKSNGKIFTDKKKLLELGHNLVKDANGQWHLYDEQGGKHKLEDGEMSLELLYGGPFMAERFAADPQNKDFIENYVILPDGIKDIDAALEIMKNRKDVLRPALIQNILVAISQQAYKGNLIAENFVKNSGQDIGRAFAVLMRNYLHQQWVENIIMVSGVGEKFGRMDGEEDMFLRAIRQGLYNQLIQWHKEKEINISDDKLENIIFGFQRSQISWEREVSAARLTAQELAKLGITAQESEKVYSLGFSIGGTKVGIALINVNGKIVAHTEIPWQEKGYIEGEDPQNLFMEKLSEDIKVFLKENNVALEDVKKFGFSLGMPVDSVKGIAGLGFKDFFLPFLNYQFVENLRRILNLSTKQVIVKIYNDAAAAGMGELRNPKGLLHLKTDAAMMVDVNPAKQAIAKLAVSTQGVAATSISSLNKHKVFEILAQSTNPVRYSTLVAAVKQRNRIETVNDQYFLGVLRVMSSMGWIAREGNTADYQNMTFELTDKGRALSALVYKYDMVSPFIEKAAKWMDILFRSDNKNEANIPDFMSYADISDMRWTTDSDEINSVWKQEMVQQIDGVLMGPILLGFDKLGYFKSLQKTGDFLNIEDLPGRNKKNLMAGFRILRNAGLFELNGARATVTPLGMEMINRVLAFGVPVSYYPSYALAEELMFGDVFKIQRMEGNKELLVNRPLNVIGSGASHKTYFEKAEMLITNLVNNMVESGKIPSHDQLSEANPYVFRVADIGSGDGTWLSLIYQTIIRENGAYGKLMKEYPALYKVEMIGVDYFEEARIETSRTLRGLKIPYQVVHGDIGKPADLKQSFEKLGFSGVNFIVRSMLDHNRPWYGISGEAESDGTAEQSTGVFGWRGTLISNHEVEQNLRELFAEWAKLTEEMVVIELHTIDDRVAAVNLDKTLDIAYQLSHLFSDQFIVEWPVFKSQAEAAGWNLVGDHQSLFPKSPEMATVSINHLVRKLGVEDRAMFVTQIENVGEVLLGDQSTKGGIDFDPAAMKFETTGNAAMMNVTPEQLEKFIDVSGFTPVIINIAPVASPRVWLGLNAKPEENQPKQDADAVGKNSLSYAIRLEKIRV